MVVRNPNMGQVHLLSGQHNVQSILVITNSTGPSIFVRINYYIILFVHKNHLGSKNSTNLVRYSHEFVTTVIVITRFGCITMFKVTCGSSNSSLLYFEGYQLPNVKKHCCSCFLCFFSITGIFLSSTGYYIVFVIFIRYFLGVWPGSESWKIEKDHTGEESIIRKNN